MGLVIAGIIMIVFGIFLTFTIIGAIIGVPLWIIGGILVLVGVFGRHKVVLQNVVTVNNAPQPATAPSQPATLLEPEAARIQAAPMQQIQDGSPSRIQ